MRRRRMRGKRRLGNDEKDDKDEKDEKDEKV